MNPEMLKQLMPMLAGMGLPHMVASIEKLAKLMGGGAQGQKGAGQKPGQQNAQASPAGAASPPNSMDPQKMMALMALMKARGMGGATA